MIKRAIFDVLNDNAAFTAQLGQYDVGSGLAPAIFTGKEIPEDATGRMVHIVVVSSVPFGCRDKRGAEQRVDVRLFDDQERSDKALRETAYDAWRLLDRVRLDINSDGYDDWGTIADAPTSLDDPEGYPGYLVSVLSRFKEVD